MSAIGPWVAPVILFSVVLAMTAFLRSRDNKKQRFEKKIADHAAKTQGKA